MASQKKEIKKFGKREKNSQGKTKAIIKKSFEKIKKLFQHHHTQDLTS